jgi:hypothetical protein
VFSKIKDFGEKMVNITGYHILIYGSQQGYQTNRAQIALYNGTKTVAYVRFNDPGMTFENDSETNGVIKMHLPSAIFQSVIDILRNEKPINVYFAQGRGFLGTGSVESVGEAEQ